MKNYKKIVVAIFPALLIQFLSGCSSDSSNNQNDIISQNNDNSNDKQVQLKNISEKYSILTVDHTCVGCGRCVAMDNEHFSMNGRSAQVVSEQNLESSLLQQAIRICPSSSINLS